jgi:hypothetical protein
MVSWPPLMQAPPPRKASRSLPPLHSPITSFISWPFTIVDEDLSSFCSSSYKSLISFPPLLSFGYRSWPLPFSNEQKWPSRGANQMTASHFRIMRKPTPGHTSTAVSAPNVQQAHPLQNASHHRTCARSAPTNAATWRRISCARSTRA